MRKRINRAAICSSANYAASKRVHNEYLKEAHASFTGLAISTSPRDSDWHPKTKTIIIFGRPIEISWEEYCEHNLKEFGF